MAGAASSTARGVPIQLPVRSLTPPPTAGAGTCHTPPVDSLCDSGARCATAEPRPRTFRVILRRLLSPRVLAATVLVAVLASSLGGLATAAGPAGPAPQPGPATDPFAVNERLARTINLGGVHELGPDENWGPRLRDEHYSRIAAAGFSAVRIPAAWDLYADTSPPYAIEPAFFARIDRALDNAESNGLAVVLNVHIYEGLTGGNPDAHRARFLALWRQIAERYADRSENLVFELFNEPNGRLDSATWNSIMTDAIAAIRESNPYRTLMVGPSGWYAWDRLNELELPSGERNLILTVHYYEPFAFTHQGAVWVDGADAWLGTRWSADRNGDAVDRDFSQIADEVRARGLPMFVGEFGAFGRAAYSDRVAYTRWVREAADNEGFTWGYWSWAQPGAFGLHHGGRDLWDPELHGALMGSGCAPTRPTPPPRAARPVQLSAAQLQVNQRIGQAALRRLDAIERWIDAGITGRDICSGALSAGNFNSAVRLAPAGIAPASPARPRPLRIASGRSQGREARLSAAQVRINQRIYQAAIRRAAALRWRLGNLTGGDVHDGAIGPGMFIAGWGVVDAQPHPATERSQTPTSRAPRPSSGPASSLSRAQLEVNQRIAQRAVREANTLRRMVEGGLVGANFRDGSLGTADLAAP